MPSLDTDGRWPLLLQGLAGLTPDQLTDRHQPCPACGGTDRYRWDRDDGPGGCYCNKCGGKDHQGGGMSGLDLLMRVRGWDFKQAMQAVEQHLGLATASTSPAPARPGKRPHRTPDKPPADAAPPLLGRAVAQFPYGPDRANPWYWIQRIPQPPRTEGGKPRKLFVHRTWLDGGWHYPSKRDAFASEWPAPRPVYRLPDLADRPDAAVVISEGEGKTDAATELLPNYVCISWTGGTAGINHTDWQPLAGRDCILWPDADEKGRDCMATLASRLLTLGCTVQLINPPDDLKPGWDLADALAESWSSDMAAEALIEWAGELLEPKAKAPEVPEVPDARGGPFACLGFDGGSYYYQPGNTGQVVRLSRSSHTSTSLLQLAPLSYWETLYPTKSGANWQAAISDLFEQQARRGIFSPDRIRGRGAWWDDGRPVLHLGDRLLVDGILHAITNQPPSRFNYQRLAAIDLPTDIEPLSDQQGADILDIASRFLWEVPASGLLLAGWAALAPVCGSLSWRPHVWLTASAGSGKSAILERFLGTLLQDVALWPEGSTSEASIRQELRADALPVIMDEAESNEQSDQKRIQSILALARVASSSGRGFVGRGGAEGTAQRFTVRSMFLLCSISTALKQGADASRFAQLTLRNPKTLPQIDRATHWHDLDRDMTALLTPKVGHQMLLRSLRLVPQIRESVAVFRRAAATAFDSQRQGDQYGTLLAGAWSLMNSRPATEADAMQLIKSNVWDVYRDAAEQPDEERCLAHILQHVVRVETDHSAVSRTVWELVEIIRGTTTSMEVASNVAEAHLGRLGLRVRGEQLMVANASVGLQRILATTGWAHSWPTILFRLPGSERVGKVRFRGMGTSTRAVAVRLSDA